MIVYRITNSINGKIYIGITTNTLAVRRRGHKASSKSSRYKNVHLYNAIRKYGFDNFIFEELAYCFDLESLNNTEIMLIKFFNSTNPEVGYNLASGGLVSKATERSRKVSSERTKKLWENKEFREKMKKVALENGQRLRKIRKGSNLWSTLTEEQKQQARLNRIGKYVGSSHHSYGKGPNYGKKLSDEHKKKIGLNHLGNTHAGVGGDHFAAKKVMCIETGEVFNSVSEAKQKYSKGNIHKAARQGTTSMGKRWKYLE
jgi:group I intron endonuclease